MRLGTIVIFLFACSDAPLSTPIVDAGSVDAAPIDVLDNGARLCEVDLTLPDFATVCARAGGSLSADRWQCPYCLMPDGEQASAPAPPCCAPTDACSGVGEPCATIRPCCDGLRCSVGLGCQP